MKRELIKHIYDDMSAFGGKEIVLGGWARSIRDSKAFGFIDLNDGSCFKGVQVVFEREKIENYDEIAKQNVGAALVVKGIVELTPKTSSPLKSRLQVLRLRVHLPPTTLFRKRDTLLNT